MNLLICLKKSFFRARLKPSSGLAETNVAPSIAMASTSASPLQKQVVKKPPRSISSHHVKWANKLSMGRNLPRQLQRHLGLLLVQHPSSSHPNLQPPRTRLCSWNSRLCQIRSICCNTWTHSLCHRYSFPPLFTCGYWRQDSFEHR